MERGIPDYGLDVGNAHCVWTGLIEHEERLESEGVPYHYESDLWVIEDTYRGLKQELLEEPSIALQVEPSRSPVNSFSESQLEVEGGIESAVDVATEKPSDKYKIDSMIPEFESFDETVEVRIPDEMDQLVNNIADQLEMVGVDIKGYQFLGPGKIEPSPQTVIRNIEKGEYVLEIETAGPKLPSQKYGTFEGIRINAEDSLIEPFIDAKSESIHRETAEDPDTWDINYTINGGYFVFEPSENYLQERERKLTSCVEKVEI